MGVEGMVMWWSARLMSLKTSPLLPTRLRIWQVGLPDPVREHCHVTPSAMVTIVTVTEVTEVHLWVCLKALP